MTTERPILMKGEMIRAILDNRKSQTRRIVKPQPEEIPKHVTRAPGEPDPSYWWSGGNAGMMIDLRDMGSFCPQGKPGDRLWCKETFWPANQGKTIHYRADMSPMDAAGFGAMYGGWKPSIFMPRKASRLTLEITAVRVERLQDISEADALAEGVEMGRCVCTDCDFEVTASGNPGAMCPDWGCDGEIRKASAKENYELLWESINGKGSWDKNPFVWILEFKPVQ